MDTMLTLKKLQTTSVDLVKKVEEPVVRYTGKMAGTVARYVPQRPAFMAGMPTMEELVDNGLAFRDRLIAEQTKFVHAWMKAMKPVLGRFDHADKAHAPKATVHMPAKKPAARTAARPAARKSA